MKLVVSEPESQALEVELDRWSERITSSISLTEVVRACRLAAARGPAAAGIVEQAHAVLAGVAMLDADTPLMRDAGRLDPVELRTLDAIHLAAAVSLGRDLGAVITFDQRLAVAARHHKLRVLSPG